MGSASLTTTLIRLIFTIKIVLLINVVGAKQLGHWLQPWQIFAYTRWVNAQTEVFIGDTAGHTINLTRNRVLDGSADWHPDGTHLVFTTTVTGNLELFSMTWDGQDKQQLTSTNTRNLRPQWSPNGEQIAFMLEQEYLTTRYDIFTLDLKTGVLRNLTQTPNSESNPRWSPDGKNVSFINDNARRDQIVTLPYGTFLMQTAPNRYHLAWSPDGTQIAYIDQTDNVTVYIQDVAPQSIPAAFAIDLRDIEKLLWSRDGKHILFIGIPPAKTTTTPSDQHVYQLDVQTGNITQLMQHSGQVRHIALSPSGKTLMFTRTDGRTISQLCFLSVETARRWCPAIFDNAFDPVWQP